MTEEARNPGLAAVFSFIFNGMGQLYNGQVIKGLAIIFISTLNMLIFMAGSILIGFWVLNKVVFAGQLAWGRALFCAGLFFICALGIYSILDAYRVAGKI